MRNAILIMLVLACLALAGCMTGGAIRGPQGYPAREDITYIPSYEMPTQMVPTPSPVPSCCEFACGTVCGNKGDASVNYCLSEGGRPMQYGFEFTCCYFNGKPTSAYSWTACLREGGQPVSMRVQ